MKWWFTFIFLFILFSQGAFAFNLSLGDTNNFHYRIQGDDTNSNIPWNRPEVADITGDGFGDVIYGGRLADSPNGADTGVAWVVNNDVVSPSTRGQVYNSSDNASYLLRFYGITGDTNFGWQIDSGDLDSDGALELAIVQNGLGIYVFKRENLGNLSQPGRDINMSTDPYWFFVNITHPGGNTDAGFADVDGDDQLDIYYMVGYDSENGNRAGAAYIINNSIFANLPNGSRLSLDNDANYSVKILGAEATSFGTSFTNPFFADLTGDGDNNLIISNSFGATYASNAGYTYVLPTLNFTGTGARYNLSNSSNILSRMDGTSASQFANFLPTVDITGDGIVELFVSVSGSDQRIWESETFNNNFSSRGYIYNHTDIPFSSRFSTGLQRIEGFSDFTNDENIDLLTADVADPGNIFLLNYSLFVTGTVVNALAEALLVFNADDPSRFTYSLGSTDINGDGLVDYVPSSSNSNYAGFSNAGNIWIIFNFPHSINGTVSTLRNGTMFQGWVNASYSVTNISAVQARLGTSGAWQDCVAADGAFDNTTEQYNCTMDTAAASEGSVVLQVRAQDQATVYSSQQLYHNISTSVDKSAPSITFSCSSSSVSLGSSLTCTCSATDTVDSSPTVTFDNSPPTGREGTFTTSCNVTDAAGFSASENVTYTITPSTGGGGGGGGTSSLSSSTSTGTTTQQFNKVSKEQPAKVTVKEGPVKSLEVKVGKEQSKVTLQVKKSSGGSKKAPGKVYEYFEVNHNFDDIEEATIKFEVKDSWLKEQKADPEGVIAWRFHNDEWQKLKTKFLGGQSYEATTPGFSLFSITVEETTEKLALPETQELEEVEQAESAPVEEVQEDSVPITEPTPLFAGASPKKNMQWWHIPVLLAVVAVVVFFARRKQ